MRCKSLIKVPEYQLEWDGNFIDSDISDGNVLKSDVFYAGTDQESTWRMELFKISERNNAELKLILVHGYQVRVSGKASFIDGGNLKGESTVSETVCNAGQCLHFYNLIPKDHHCYHYNEKKIVCILHIYNESGTLPYVNKVNDFSCSLTDIASLLFQQKHSDVSVVSKDGQEFPAHKAILAARSDVFAAMFDTEMVENLEGKVNIPDMDGCDVEEMLRYIYSGNFSKWSQALCQELLQAADKYKINGMKTTCTDYLKYNMTVESSVKVFTLADLQGDDVLKKVARKFIIINLKKVVSTPGWNIMVKEYPNLVDEIVLKMSECLSIDRLK